MINKKLSRALVGTLTPAVLFLGVASAVLADEGVDQVPPLRKTTEAERMPIKAKIDERKAELAEKKAEQMSKDIAKGQEAIDKRIKDISELKERLGQMKNLSDEAKAKLLQELDAEIAKLNELKAKIGATTDAKILKEDLGSITKDNRVYMDVQPRAKILAAADRVKTLVGMLNATATKLEARIASAKTAGKDVTAFETALTDMKSKLAEATTLVEKVIAGVSNITADGGDKTLMKANADALKEARANLKLANDALKTANADLKTITKGVRTPDAKKEFENRVNKGDAPLGNSASGTTNNGGQ